jgi:hypothetical protein
MTLSIQAAAWRVSDLKVLLNGLRSASRENTIVEFKALVEALGQPGKMIPLLRSILNDTTTLAEVAGRSYPHVNNFDKIVLVGSSEPDAYRLTLHLWRPPYPEDLLKQELIHDHRFNFWSTILTGTLSSEVFLKCSSPASKSGLRTYREYRYIPEVARSTAFTEFYNYQGHVSLLSSGIHHKYAGEIYYLDAPTIHRIVLPQSSITCSLVLRGPRLRPYSCVYNTSYPSRDTFRENKMFSEPDLWARLFQLLEVLEG